MAPIITDQEIRDKAREVRSIIGAPRCAWIREALAVEGLEVTSEEYEQIAYLEAIEATPTALQRQQARQMARTQSGCALVYEHYARKLAVHWPLLWKFYGQRFSIPIEQVITADRAFAQKVGAWVDASTWREGMPFPKEADGLIIGGKGPSWVRGEIESEHMFLIVAWILGLIHSIDGGQPGVRLRTRALVEVWTKGNPGQRTGELWAASINMETGLPDLDGQGRPKKGRRVLGWIDPTRLPYLSPPTCLDGEATEPGYPDEATTGR